MTLAQLLSGFGEECDMDRRPNGTSVGATLELNGAATASLRVLVVDDNCDAADTLTALLRLWGHDARSAYDGLAALDTAAEFRPDCMFLDISMPGMDGFEVAQNVRLTPTLKQTWIVALSAYSTDEHRMRVREAGFDHCLVKPVDPVELTRLLAMIAKTLRLAGRTEALARQNVKLARETKGLITEVKTESEGVREELREVQHEIREARQEIRESRGDIRDGDGYPS
jgi:two-component system OmpR family response regulator